MSEGEALRRLLEYLTEPGKVIRFSYSEPMVRFVMTDVPTFVRCMGLTHGDVLAAARQMRNLLSTIKEPA